VHLGCGAGHPGVRPGGHPRPCRDEFHGRVLIGQPGRVGPGQGEREVGARGVTGQPVPVHQRRQPPRLTPPVGAAAAGAVGVVRAVGTGVTPDTHPVAAAIARSVRVGVGVGVAVVLVVVEPVPELVHLLGQGIHPRRPRRVLGGPCLIRHRPRLTTRHLEHAYIIHPFESDASRPGSRHAVVPNAVARPARR